MFNEESYCPRHSGFSSILETFKDMSTLSFLSHFQTFTQRSLNRPQACEALFKHPRLAMRNLTLAQMIQPPPTSGQGSEECGQVRVRQHLNPLARRWSQPVVLPDDWYTKAFRDVTLPLIVDVGVAKGRFLLKLASQNKSRNFLGLEIREPLVHQANRCAADAGLSNLFYIACNANVSLARILDDAPQGVLREIYVQFCDPWFKKRHAKRRMVNPPLVDAIYQALHKSASERRRDGETMGVDPFVFMQSDVFEVATEMRDIFDNHGGFLRISNGKDFRVDDGGWLLENPLGLATEREIAVQKKSGSVYRALYHLKHRSTRNDLDTESLPKTLLETQLLNQGG